MKKIARKYKSQYDEQTDELQTLKKKVEDQEKLIHEQPQTTATEAASAPPAVEEAKIKELNEKNESLEIEVKKLKEADEQNKVNAMEMQCYIVTSSVYKIRTKYVFRM